MFLKNAENIAQQQQQKKEDQIEDQIEDKEYNYDSGPESPEPTNTGAGMPSVVDNYMGGQ